MFGGINKRRADGVPEPLNGEADPIVTRPGTVQSPAGGGFHRSPVWGLARQLLGASRVKSRALLGLNILILAAGMVVAARAAAPVATPLADDPACTSEDRRFMARAYELAREADKRGDSPIGAVLVRKGKIIYEYSNSIVTERDVTMHAETGMLSKVTPIFDKATLAECTLYTSTEPCVMCCGSITYAGLPKVVYGTTALQVLRLSGRPVPFHPLECREVFQRIGNTRIVVAGPLMEVEGFKVREEHLAKAKST
jgi:tRNA(Arg) A34 adenosine deaminase TadA